MAVIAPFLQRQLYDEAVTEMADELRLKANILDSSDSDASDSHINRGERQRWATQTEDDAAEQEQAITTLRKEDALRRRKRPGAPSGADKVNNWLLGPTDWSQQFQRSSTAGNSFVAVPAGRSGASRLSAGVLAGVFGPPAVFGAGRQDLMALWLRFNLKGKLEAAFPVVSPNSRGKTAWDILIMIFVLYSAVTVPLAFSYGLPESQVLVAVEWTLTAFYIVDIAISFRTAYYDDDGNMVRYTLPVAKRYIRTWFPIDFVATIPFDAIAIAAGLGSTQSQLMILAVLKTPRLLRLIKLMRLLDRLRNANIIKVLQLVLLMMMIAHWLACIWYVIARFTPDEDKWGFDALLDNNKVTWYLCAFYYSFLLLIGDNITAQNNYERVFFIVTLIAGACFYSAVVGNMALLVANMNTVAVRFRQKLDMTQDALRYMRVPETQQERVQAFYDYITAFSHPGSEGLGFLSELTKGINEDLHMFLHSETLKRIYLFKECEPAFIRSLGMRMKIVTFIPREIIFRQGDLGHEMYIIRSGCVAVVSKNNEVMSLLQAGGFFGEIALLTQARRTAKCVALSNCDLAILNSLDLKILMKEFPDSANRLQAAARERLRQLQIAGRAGTNTAEADSGDGEDHAKKREHEELRRLRTKTIARFSTGRALHPSKLLQQRASKATSDNEANDGVAKLNRRDSSGGASAGIGGPQIDPWDGRGSNASRSSIPSLSTEDSAHRLLFRRRPNSGSPSSSVSLPLMGARPSVEVATKAAATVALTAESQCHGGSGGGGDDRNEWTSPDFRDCLQGSCKSGKLGMQPAGSGTCAAQELCPSKPTRGASGPNLGSSTGLSQGLGPEPGDGFSRRSTNGRRSTSTSLDGIAPGVLLQGAPTTSSPNTSRSGPARGVLSPDPSPGNDTGPGTGPGNGNGRSHHEVLLLSLAAVGVGPGPGAAGLSGCQRGGSGPVGEGVEQVIPPNMQQAGVLQLKLRQAAKQAAAAGARVVRGGCNAPQLASGPSGLGVEVTSTATATVRRARRASMMLAPEASAPYDTMAARASLAAGPESMAAPPSVASSRRSSGTLDMTGLPVSATPLASGRNSPMPGAFPGVPTAGGPPSESGSYHGRHSRSQAQLVLPHGSLYASALAATAASVAALGHTHAGHSMVPRIIVPDAQGSYCVRPSGAFMRSAFNIVHPDVEGPFCSRLQSMPTLAGGRGQATAAHTDIAGPLQPDALGRLGGIAGPTLPSFQRPSETACATLALEGTGSTSRRSAVARRAETGAHSDIELGPRGSQELSGGGAACLVTTSLTTSPCMGPALASGGRRSDVVVVDTSFHSILDGSARGIKRLGSRELSQYAPPGHEDAQQHQLQSPPPLQPQQQVQNQRYSGSGCGDRNTRLRYSRVFRKGSDDPYASDLGGADESESRRDDPGTRVSDEDIDDGGPIEWIRAGLSNRDRRHRQHSCTGAPPPRLVLTSVNALTSTGGDSYSPAMQHVPGPGLPAPRAAGASGGGHQHQHFSPRALPPSMLADLQKAELKLSRRAAELDLREAELERREADMARLQSEAARCLAETAVRQEDVAAQVEINSTIHATMVELARTIAELMSKVEQLGERLDDTDAAVTRIEGQQASGRQGDDFLGLSNTGISNTLSGSAHIPLERGVSFDKRQASADKKTLSGQASGSSTRRTSALMYGDGVSIGPMLPIASGSDRSIRNGGRVPMASRDGSFGQGALLASRGLGSFNAAPGHSLTRSAAAAAATAAGASSTPTGFSAMTTLLRSGSDISKRLRPAASITSVAEAASPSLLRRGQSRAGAWFASEIEEQVQEG